MFESVKLSIVIQVFLFLLIPVLLIIKEKGLTLYKPIILLTLITFIEYAFPAIYMIFVPQEFLLYYNFTLPSLSKALSFTILTYLFLILGYYLCDFNKFAKNLNDKLLAKLPNINSFSLKIENTKLVIFVFYLLGWIARIILLKSGIYFQVEGNVIVKINPEFYVYANNLSLMSNFPLISLCLLFIEWLKNGKKGYLLTSSLLTIIEFIYAFPSGSKEKVLMPLFLILFLYSIKKKLPLLPIAVLSVFSILFIFPFVTIYRNVFRTSNLISDLSFASTLYFNMFSNIKETLNMIFVMVFGNRLNYILVLAVIIENTPKIWDFMKGYTYSLFFIGMIPRILWTGKPLLAAFGNKFGYDYGFISAFDYATSVAMLWIGEMFINFGWFGILCGFFYGILYRFVYNYFFKYKKLTNISLVLYVFALYYMVRGDEFAAQTLGVIKICFVTFIVIYPFLKKVKT